MAPAQAAGDCETGCAPACTADQQDITAMSMALEDACRALRVGGNPNARQILAATIDEFARRGERSPTVLRDRVLSEVKGTDILEPFGRKP